jgi:asparagine synthase (glutamine-hydrolysing)
MCGIFGQFTPRGADPALIERMAAALAHRGPDGYGTHLSQSRSLAFGAGRLAIIDLSAPAGPIFSEDRAIAVAFNGEIYNHRALRAELEGKGHVFATCTDTEVIVHGYEQWGVAVMERLRGMFALAIWDERKQWLVLARDRLGEKPLYYTEAGNGFTFASEIKALFEDPALPRAVNPDALPTYLALGYTPPPLTMFRGVLKLPPGAYMLVDRNGPRIDRYWKLQMETDDPHPMPYAEAVREARRLIREAVETRLMSDVPLGAFLSGGLDSTAVVALVAQLTGRPVRTFTVGYDVPKGSRADEKFNIDTRYAALAAKALGTDHHEILIRPDERLAEFLPHLIYAMDEPIAQPAIIQTVYVSALARHSGVPVLLSGDAGDELFAGYPAYTSDRMLERYLAVPEAIRTHLITPLLERLPPHRRFDSLRKIAEKSHLTDDVSRYLTWMKIVPQDRISSLFADHLMRRPDYTYTRLTAALKPFLAAPHTRHFADRIAFTSLNLWVAEDSNMRVDKMSMAMSIEARAPLEDHHLAAFALKLPLHYKLRAGDVKRVFKDAVRDLIPAEILARPKWGFFPPLSDWLRSIFRPLVEKYLHPDRVAAVGLFDPAAVSGIVRDHIDKNKYELWPLWALFVFHLWHALYIERDLTLPAPLRPADLVH